MNRFNRTLSRLALAAVAAAAFLSQAQAAPVVFISPTAQTISGGGHAFVDIMVSGLDKAAPTGGFALTLSYVNSIVSGVSYVNDPNGRMGALPLDLSGGFTPGSLDLFFAADASETLASLAVLQSAGSFRLATLDFLGGFDGVSPLTLSGVSLSTWDGGGTLAGVTTRDGEICVGCKAVPEPTSMLLVATAIAALAYRRRKAA